MRTSQSKISSDGIRFSISLKNKKSRESFSHGNPQKFLWYYFCDVVIAICIVVLFYSMFIISCFQHLTTLFRDSSPGLPLWTVTYIILSAWSIAEWLAALSATSQYFPLPCCCSCCCSCCSCCWSCCCFCCITCATESIERFYFQMFFYLHPCTASATYLIFAFLKISLDVSSSASKFAENPY